MVCYAKERLTIQLLHRATPSEYTHAEQGIRSPNNRHRGKSRKNVTSNPLYLRASSDSLSKMDCLLKLYIECLSSVSSVFLAANAGLFDPHNDLQGHVPDLSLPLLGSRLAFCIPLE